MTPFSASAAQSPRETLRSLGSGLARRNRAERVGARARRESTADDTALWFRGDRLETPHPASPHADIVLCKGPAATIETSAWLGASKGARGSDQPGLFEKQISS